MALQGLESDPLRSTIELSPVLVPYVISFFMYVGIFANFPIYLQLTQNLTELETVKIWTLISAIALLVGGITRIPAGLLSDQIGRFPAFLVAYSVYFVSVFVVLGFSTNLIYIIAMCLIRFGSNIVAMTGRAVVSTSLRDRGLKNGLLQSMSGFGSFVGPFSLGYVLDHYQPKMIMYVSMGIILFDFLLFIGIYHLTNRWLNRNELVSDLDFSPIGAKNVLKYLPVLKIPQVIEVLILFSAVGLSFGLLQSIYSIYGYNILNLKPTTIGLITGLGALSQVIAAPITGRLYTFIKDEYMRIVSWVIMVLATVAASLSPIFVEAFYIAYFIYNVGMSSYFTTEITRLSQLVKAEEFSFTFGLASSLFILGASFAGFISPYLYHLLPEMNFFAATLVTTSSLILVAMTANKWLKERAE